MVRESESDLSRPAQKPGPAIVDTTISPEAKVEIETVLCEPGHWRIIMRFPEPVCYTRQVDGISILLEFNQPVDAPGLIDAQAKTGYVLERFGNGFNTLYLESRRPLSFVTAAEGSCFYLDLVPNYEIPPESNRWIKLAHARLLIEDRCYLAAYGALYDLLDEFPNDRDVLVMLAGLETLTSRWQNAVQILQEVKTFNPWDEEVGRFLCETFCPHSSFIRYTRQLQRTVHFAAEQFHRLEAEYILGCSDCNFLYAGGIFESVTGHLSQVVDEVGNTVGFRGTRFDGGLYLRNERSSGLSTTGRLWITQGVVWGGGAEISWLWPAIQGEIGFMVDWHKPYWELFETIRGYGREDRFKFHTEGVYNRYLYWNFDGGAHRVGIRGVPNGLTSLLVDSNIFCNVCLRNPIVALNYGLDAEWVIHHDQRIGPVGNVFEPIPLASYEYHSLRVYLFYEWREFWFLTLFGGGTFDRLGGNAPTGGITLRYVKPCPCGWEVELSAIAYPSTQVEGASTQYYTANITIRF